MSNAVLIYPEGTSIHPRWVVIPTLFIGNMIFTVTLL